MRNSDSRFREDPDPRFWALNRSLGVDLWLAPHDLAQSRAHAKALLGVGVLTDSELDEILVGLDQIEGELEADTFAFTEADEDIHMAVERRLAEICGPVAGKLHTARSRNDQVATDLALAVRGACDSIISSIDDLMGRILELAETHSDWTLPGYTHLQRAQPVYLGHHLMAYFWMFERDRRRFGFARGEAGSMPLGSGAMAGVNWEIDRRKVAEDLGFDGVTPNSMDGASNRDFALDFLSAVAICSTHLSRLGSELVIWSSSEFGFARLAEPFTSGSSIMPQKQNPDSAEILRGRAPRSVADFAALAGVLHALPLTYAKDLQEDKVPVRDAIDSMLATLEMARGMLEGVVFDHDRMETAAGDEMLGATEVADLLVRKGMPFRDAHAVVGSMVRDCLDRGLQLSELEDAELTRYSELLDGSFREAISAPQPLESKLSEGGTSSGSFRRQMELARDLLSGKG